MAEQFTDIPVTADTTVEVFPDAFPDTQVTEFKSASLNKDPLIYPGDRPIRSFITDGEIVSSLNVAHNGDNWEFTVGQGDNAMLVDDYLSQHGAAPMADRIPVLSYGANVCPASLKSKFTKVDRADAQVIPTAYANLEGFDVVWSGGPGVNGNFIAALYSGQETESTQVQVGISFLTREQILVMHATELAYDLRTIEVELAGSKLPAYYYAGHDTVYLENNKPVAVKAVPATGRDLESATTSDMLDKILHEDVVKQFLTDKFGADIDTPKDYISAVSNLKKSPGTTETPRRVLKMALLDIISKMGKSKDTDVKVGTITSWHNPSLLGSFSKQPDTIPVYVLPTSELPIDSWKDKDARKKVLHALNTHFARTFEK